MSTRHQLDAIRIIPVNKEGKEAAFGSLCEKLSNITPQGFVAIDTEFSGLGSDPHLKHDNLNTRYLALRNLSNSSAIFSLGISVFDVATRDVTMTDPEPIDDGTQMSYHVATYDMLMSCQSDFSFNAAAGQFLVSHSFDFNEMFQSGIPYERASTEKADENVDEKKGVEKKGHKFQWGPLPRGLLWRIGRQAIPIIVHNGLLDLAFLYAAFQGPLPDTLNGFVCALLECVPAGYWDTKVIATNSKERTTFLGYLFAKCVTSERLSVENFTGLPSEDFTNPKPIKKHLDTDTLCALFSYRGFCHRGSECPFLHDPFKIVQEEKAGEAAKDNKEAMKRYKIQSKLLKKKARTEQMEIAKMSKRQRKKLVAESLSTGNGSEDFEKMDDDEGGLIKDFVRLAHTAGWDAFCTGYVFAAFRASRGGEKMEKDRNHIALPYKLSSLLLRKSQFADLDKVEEKEEEEEEGKEKE